MRFATFKLGLTHEQVFRARRKSTGVEVAIKIAVDASGENNCKEPFLHASTTHGLCVQSFVS